ncbi:unnamed protein product [Microthlaspi erraticum]|uniref:Uncharacterized protein n=1 Tax=Microthlaspi erraticum TaxID=1685480 RepID=A0A6D2J4P7_9BRAS|nr:unnamed protein product [Microthlaspi erraticum]
MQKNLIITKFVHLAVRSTRKPSNTATRNVGVSIVRGLSSDSEPAVLKATAAEDGGIQDPQIAENYGGSVARTIDGHGKMEVIGEDSGSVLTLRNVRQRRRKSEESRIPENLTDLMWAR